MIRKPGKTKHLRFKKLKPGDRLVFDGGVGDVRVKLRRGMRVRIEKGGVN